MSWAAFLAGAMLFMAGVAGGVLLSVGYAAWVLGEQVVQKQRDTVILCELAKSRKRVEALEAELQRASQARAN